MINFTQFLVTYTLVTALNTNVVQSTTNKTTNWHFLLHNGSSASEQFGGGGIGGYVSKCFSFCAGAGAAVAVDPSADAAPGAPDW